MSDSEPLLIEPEGGVLTLTLNDPPINRMRFEVRALEPHVRDRSGGQAAGSSRDLTDKTTAGSLARLDAARGGTAMGVCKSMAERWRNRAEYRRTRRSYGEWKTEHPEASFADFYVADSVDKIARGKSPPHTVGLHVDYEWAARRASKAVEMMRANGLAPNHVCVDYGCGSLWIGEALMRYLDPGCYVGLDVTDRFYDEGLARLSPEFVAEKRPVLRIISEESLEEIRAREPDYVISTDVLMHVPPKELVAFFGSIVRLAAPHTRIDVIGKAGLYTFRSDPRSWRHSRRAIQASLAELGFEARFPKRSGSGHFHANRIVIVRRDRDG